MKEFTVTENDSGQRLDKFITKLMPRLPQSMMYKGFRKNCVKLNGKHAKNGAVFVEKGDTVALYFKDEFFETNREFKYTPYELDIVYEDDNILVINKAPGILSHSDEHGCGLTVIDMVQSYLYDNGEYNPQTSQTFKPALCNRLDRNTGGLIIAAKNSLALREINSNIKRRNIQKFYTAVVEGNPPDDGRLTSQHLVQHADPHVGDEVIDAVEGFASGDRECFRSCDTDHQCPGQARSGGHSDGINVG